MDEYSDAVLLVKPVIFISLKEVVDTHKVEKFLYNYYFAPLLSDFFMRIFS